MSTQRIGTTGIPPCRHTAVSEAISIVRTPAPYQPGTTISYSHLLRGDQRRALKQFERALSLDPGNSVVRNNLRILRSGKRRPVTCRSDRG